MTRDVSKGYDPKGKNIRHSPSQRNTAKYLYEVEGKKATEVANTLSIHPNVIRRWVKKYEWEQGKQLELIEKTELMVRLEKARELGIGEVDQMIKVKQLMEATAQQRSMVPGPDGRMTEVTEDIPDYKIQNEGVKRAMEITGTKIDRKEIEHKGTQEVVHRYELPAKIPID